MINVFFVVGRKSFGRCNNSGRFPFSIPIKYSEVRFELGDVMGGDVMGIWFFEVGNSDDWVSLSTCTADCCSCLVRVLCLGSDSAYKFYASHIIKPVCWHLCLCMMCTMSVPLMHLPMTCTNLPKLSAADLFQTCLNPGCLSNWRYLRRLLVSWLSTEFAFSLSLSFFGQLFWQWIL